jgi:tetratricopeptide (TPR) repeat protein
LLRDAVAIGKRTHDRAHRDVAWAFHDLALLSLHDARYGEANALVLEAIAMIEKILDRHDSEAQMHLNYLANLLSLVGRKREAEELYREASGGIMNEYEFRSRLRPGVAAE